MDLLHPLTPLLDRQGEPMVRRDMRSGEADVEGSVAVARIADREGVVAAVLMDYAAQNQRQLT